MFSKKYRLSYLPLFYDDLDEKIAYIDEKLKNPKAASDLISQGLLPRSSAANKLSEAEANTPQLAAGKFIG